MIYDHIDNINRYKDPTIRQGLDLLCSLVRRYAQGNLPQEGSHPMENGLRYNVDHYLSKMENPTGYEAHRRYVDIQFLLEGKEIIRMHNLEGMECTSPYESCRDAGFYLPNDNIHTDLFVGNGHFAIFFPNDAHMPQLCIDSPIPVIKVVVKIPVQDDWISNKR